MCSIRRNEEEISRKPHNIILLCTLREKKNLTMLIDETSSKLREHWTFIRSKVSNVSERAQWCFENSTMFQMSKHRKVENTENGINTANGALCLQFRKNHWSKQNKTKQKPLRWKPFVWSNILYEREKLFGEV